jgi:hypothetical protein
MKRVQLFEFEDFDWFPTTFRSTITKLIVVVHQLLGTKEVLGELIRRSQTRVPFTRIVDMGSGSGGIMPAVVAHFNEQHLDTPIDLLLTDLHPHPEFVKSFQEAGRERMSYHPDPLDATQLADAPPGLKTMVNSFHHMPPPMARKILATAQSHKQPILIYEMARNNLPTAVWALLLPLTLPIVALMAVLLLPFIKPLRFPDILFTWLIPVIPIFYAWDGQASVPRMYTFEDIKNELLPEEVAHYSWEMAPAQKRNGKELGYYLLGFPNQTLP